SADRITPFLDHLPADERAALAHVGAMLGRWAVFVDPPLHTRLRALMNKAFTSSALAALRPRIAAIVEDLLDAYVESDNPDFIAGFAYPLPATVIAGMVGVPDSDLDLFKSWSDDLATFVGSAQATPDKRERAERSAAEMTDYFGSIIAERRRHPVADQTIIDHMIAAREGDDALSEAELVANAVLLLFAGHETTTNLFGNGLLALLRHPDQLAILAADPTLATGAVEEILRYDGPIGTITRVGLEDVVLHGRTIKAGERVFSMIHAANRDPRRFEDPHRFDITRKDNRHIVFGYGIHFCLGAPLARMEGEIGLPALIDKLRDIELLDADPPWHDSLVLRGVKSLPIAFRASRPTLA
ncbi:MAG: cytochrome P450, partial [Alphaproteobacteria bacterium]|nr:cytochrome P450 [Alphaproteobacteria bacterium]